MGFTIVLLLSLLFSTPIFAIVQCISKGERNSRKLDRSKPRIDARSHGKSRKKSSETAIEGVIVAPSPKSKEIKLKEQVTQQTPPNEAAKTKTKKKEKSKEKTVTKTTVTTEEYDTGEEVTAQDTTEKQKTVCVTAEEKDPSKREQQTQDTTLEVPKKKKKKKKTEEFLDSQGDDDTLKCVKSICN